MKGINFSCRLVFTASITVMYVPFPLDQVELRAPLPVSVWDPDGVLLLRKGEMIRDEAHRDLLESRLPMVKEDEFRQWTFRYTTAIDRMVRGNERLEAIAGVTRPMGLEPEQTDKERPLDERWLDLHAVLALLLHQGAEAQDFLPRLLQLEQRFLALLSSRVDDSLFLLVQMLHDRALGYTTTHALLSAVLCREVSAQLGFSPQQRQSLVRAALTMNIGMSRLHDQLSSLAGQPSPVERQAIAAHAQDGTQILHRHGVRDEAWLKLVRHHHRVMPPVDDLQKVDPLVTMAQLLGLADVYVARISPRASRRALPTHQAARNIYLAANGQPTLLGAAFIKTLGVYIPGSYVRLASGELAVVVRRGRKANTPLVLALVGRHGMPLGEPTVRDTRDPGQEVVAGLVSDEIKVRIPPAKLLARL